MYKAASQNTKVLHSVAARLFAVFCSIKPAIAALSLIGLVSIAGAVVPQNAAPDEYVRIYGNFISSILSKSGLTNVFASWLFLTPAVYLIASMTICSANRLPNILKTAKQNSILFGKSEYEKSQYYRYFSLPHKGNLTAENVADKFAGILQKSYYKITNRLAQNGTCYITAAKGCIGLAGPFLIHLSLIVITVGAVWTATRSYSHFLDIAVGESSPLPGTPYSVHLHDFLVEYHKGTDLPSMYTSVLSLAQNEHTIGQGRLTVNKPLTVEGISFYQMTYNPSVSDVTVTIVRLKDGATLGEFKLLVGKETYIEKLELSIKAVDLLPDFALTADGVAVSRTAIFKNPAVLLDVSIANKAVVSKWVFQSPSEFHRATVEGYEFRLKDFTVRTISGIKVIRDRAIPLVYTGFFLLTAGAFLSCYVFHRRVWIMVTFSEEQIQLYAAGNCNRNILDFQREINRCIERLSSSYKDVPL